MSKALVISLICLTTLIITLFSSCTNTTLTSNGTTQPVSQTVVPSSPSITGQGNIIPLKNALFVFDANTKIIGLTAQADNIWAISPDSVFRVKTNSGESVKWEFPGLTDPVFSAIATDLAGNIWVGSDQGISRYDGVYWTNYSVENGLLSNRVRSIFILNDIVQIGYFVNGSSGFVDNQWYMGDTYMYGRPDFPVPSISVMIKENRLVYWTGSDEGLIRSPHLTRFTIANGLPSNVITALLVDNNSYLWVGTDKGLAKCKLTDDYVGLWETFKSDNPLLESGVNAIYMDKDNAIWIGTSSGLACLNKDVWRYYTVKNGLPDNSVRGIAQDSQNRLWLGTDKGLCRYDVKK